MTQAKAIQILIRHACRDAQGTGCGMRSLPSEAEMREITQAVEKMWPKAYAFPLGQSERYNLGIPRS